MKKVVKLVLLAVLVAVGVWLWFFLFPSPEEIIRHRLEKLARTVSFSSNDGNLARLAGVAGVADFFSTNVEVNIEVPGRMQHSFMGRDEITQATMYVRSKVTGLIVKFPDIDVTVAPGKQTATADVTLDATVSGQPNAVVQEMKFTFQKIDGQWLIVHIETVRTLS
jgi:hypothetical protein